MTQNRAVSPSPRNRSRKKSRSPWPIYLGGGLLVFLAFFGVGLHGLPHRAPKPDAPLAAPLVTRAAPPAAVEPNRVSVKELPVEDRPARRKREKPKKADAPATAADPSPPAVGGVPAESRPSPVGSARVADDSAPRSPTAASAPDAAPAGDAAGDAAPPARGFRVQAGSFPDEAAARELSDRLAAAGYRPSTTTSRTPEGAAYLVQVGPFAEKKDADAAVRDLSQQGIDAQVADE